MSKLLAFVMDPIERVNVHTDTSFAFMLGATSLVLVLAMNAGCSLDRVDATRDRESNDGDGEGQAHGDSDEMNTEENEPGGGDAAIDACRLGFDGGGLVVDCDKALECCADRDAIAEACADHITPEECAADDGCAWDLGSCATQEVRCCPLPGTAQCYLNRLVCEGDCACENTVGQDCTQDSDCTAPWFQQCTEVPAYSGTTKCAPVCNPFTEFCCTDCGCVCHPM